MIGYYLNTYRGGVDRNLLYYFEEDLILSISLLSPQNPNGARLLYLAKDDNVNFTQVMDAINSRDKSRFDSKFYISGAETGWFIVDGRPVDILATEVLNTQDFKDLYRDYMNRHGIGLSLYEKFFQNFKHIFDLLEKVKRGES